MSFDTDKCKLSQNNFTLGYKAADFQLHTHVNDGAEFGGSIYQKVNEKIEMSIHLVWTASSTDPRAALLSYVLKMKCRVFTNKYSPQQKSHCQEGHHPCPYAHKKGLLPKRMGNHWPN